MARRDDAFGGGFAAPTDALPAFFNSGSVDDKKYESLLEDLRAHDLLGPADADETATSALGGSSLFFNNAFSAAFMGNFSDSLGSGFHGDAAPAAASSASAASKPPPGFARAPPGLAPTETDLKWARGQQAFSQLTSSSSAASPYASGKDDASDVLDANEIPSLKALGLDDDDVATPVKRTVAPPPGVPAPSAIPPPPGAWQQQLPPPPAPPQHPHHAQHHMPPPPPPQGPPPPPGMQHHHQQYPHQQQQQQQQQQYPHPPYAHAPPGHGPPPHMHPMHMGHPPPPPFGMGGPPPPPHMGHPPPHMHMQMRGPHPPPPPPPPGHGGMPYPPPMMQMPPPNFGPRFKMMTPRDINFVVQAQTKWIRSSDPFSDDYYFHNYMQKRSRGPVARPGGRGLPLPSWKLEHIKSVDRVDSSRAAKSREWETQNNVLGRNNTRSLYRPKQALNLAADADDDTIATSESSEPTATSAAAESSEELPKASSSSAAPMVVKSKQEVFRSDLWAKREQIDRGSQCLLSLQDARHLLDARGINVQQFHSMDAQSMDPALSELRTRTTTLLLELAGLLGVVVPPAQEPNSPVACDVEQLYRILSVAKGKRLMSRALPLLHPSARFVLLPQLVEFLLSAQGVNKIASAGDASTPIDEEDERLCQTLVLTLLYHPPAPTPELLTECLTRAMRGHDLHSLRVLLYNRGRAEALQALLQRGGASISEAASDETKAQWSRSQASFVALATAIKQTA